ncbi:hypothetical protein AB832_03860, partial [Flavobacteriaceae bacterium (ex Bugula neritina AB1)]
KSITYIITSIILIFSYGNTSVVPNPNAKKITVAVQQKPEILIGKQNREALLKKPYRSWFTKNFEEYTVDSKIIDQLKPKLKDISIKIFMGTWCSDSQRETPTFYKILDAANYNYSNLALITVSEEKDTPDGLEKGLDIQRVPTFIFYKNSKEIGRYVEFARETLEKDMLAIVTNKGYKHSYED